MKILHIDSSVLGNASVTRELTAGIVGDLRRADPRSQVTYVDLDRSPLPHLSSVQPASTAAGAVAEPEPALRAFLESDVIVIGAPMYNFAIPSTLKAWVDRICVAGTTFRYTASGPEGLAGGRTVIVATAAGGLHAGQPSDFVEPYLRQVFGFLGITDLQFARADGVALSAEHRRLAVQAAREMLGERLLAA